MHITHILHSGFMAEFDSAVLIFDYYTGELPEFDREKPLYVFVSHRHADHLSFGIFTDFEGCADVSYILSWDIRQKYNDKYLVKRGLKPEHLGRLHFMKAHESLDLGGLHVETLKSTDEGVAYIVEFGGKCLYHAGDLNWWSWEGEGAGEEAEMEKAYRHEVDSLVGKHIDMAFLVLDPRQKERYCLGFDYFMRTVGAAAAFPMHYRDDASVIDAVIRDERSAPYRAHICTGRTFDL